MKKYLIVMFSTDELRSAEKILAKVANAAAWQMEKDAEKIEELEKRVESVDDALDGISMATGRNKVTTEFPF